MKKPTTTRKLAICAMVTALSVLFLYASEAVSYARLICLFLVAFTMHIPTREGQYGYCWISFFATAIISFFILPSRISWFFYVAVVGHYAIIHRLIYNGVNVGWLKSLLMLLYCNIGSAVLIYLLYLFFEIDPYSLLPDYPLAICIIVLELCFLFLDLAFNICSKLYEKRLRPFLMHT